MKRTQVEAVLWMLAALVALFAWRETRGVVPPAAAQAGERAAVPPAPLVLAPGPLSYAAATITRADPFRLDRHPSAVAFSSRPDAVGGMAMPPPPPPPAPPKPQLAVSGIVGPPWTALLEGVPGRDGPVTVRTGDQVDALRIRRVDRDGVTVVGMDTTWRLSLKRTWQ